MFFIFISIKNNMDLTVMLFHYFSNFQTITEAFTILISCSAFPPHLIFSLHHNSNMMFK